MLRRDKQKLSNEPTQKKPLRLWPGVLIVILQWTVRFVIPVFAPGMKVYGILGGLFGGLAIIVWWAFFSRAPMRERWGAVALIIIFLIAAFRMTHPSVATGMQGFMFYFYSFPVLSLAFVIWAVVSPHLSGRIRFATMIVTILASCGMWTLLRSDGISGDGAADFAWRWAETYEEQFLSEDTGEVVTNLPSIAIAVDSGAYWPGFRGIHRDNIVHGVRIKTDWTTAPPVELWRRPVGPGCSSCAIRGIYLFTQEQYSDEEVVSCYDITTGKPVWMHRDEARFWDSHAGAGPRSTPTIEDSCLYTLGATGILNALDARDGTAIWSRNAAEDIKAELPGWGFTSSPLIVDDIIVIALAGTLVAYDIDTGQLRWTGPDGGAGYSSPHLVTIDGTVQVLLMSAIGITALAPANGTVLWKHAWEEERIVQPAVIENGDLLLSAGGTKGIRRVTVRKGSDGWTINEHWTSMRLRPNFNDFVIHKGYAFGFTGPILTCIDIENGERVWKGGRYAGEIILLAEQDLLLILSEQGDLVLVKAVPDEFKELASITAIKGKTWNHPALAGDILVVRNSREMAAYRLPLAGSG